MLNKYIKLIFNIAHVKMIDSVCWSQIIEYCDKETFLAVRRLCKDILNVSLVSNVWWHVNSTNYYKYKESICNPCALRQIPGSILYINIPKMIVNVKVSKEIKSDVNANIVHYSEYSNHRTRVNHVANTSIIKTIFDGYEIVYKDNFESPSIIVYKNCIIRTNGYKITAKQIILDNSTVDKRIKTTSL